MTQTLPDFLNAKQAADYLDLNEKKLYALAKTGTIPATKVTGKWLFPKKLIERWLLESSHHGIFNDRLLIAGSDDPLLAHLFNQMASELGTQAIIGYIPTGTKLGLSLLEKGHVDLCTIHWGNVEESKFRHPALIRQHARHQDWAIVQAFTRTQGLIMKSDVAGGIPPQAFNPQWRWAVRQSGAGSHRAFLDWLKLQHCNLAQLNQSVTCLTERSLGSAIARKVADIGFGSESTAGEFHLHFHPVATEAFDWVIPKNLYFRDLVQQMLAMIQREDIQDVAAALGGYKFEWG